MRFAFTFGLLLLLAAPAYADAGNVLLEPLVMPETNVAVQRAQKTLIDAGKLVAAELDGKQLLQMGFTPRTFKMGELSFNDVRAVYKQNAAGEAEHAGYVFNMRVRGDKNGPNVAIAIGRHGRIANRLFSGGDGVFAQVASLPAEHLDVVLHKDLASDRPLDLASRWTAHRQNQLGGTKPYKLVADRPVVARPTSVVAPAPAPKLRLRDRLRILVKGK
jgi:hypothetical protein